jgi:dolichyl-diphosphooligosaccharide--protein glycosyltransferase
MLQQNRFAYYYSVNAAILSAYLGIKVLDLAGWKDIRSPFAQATSSISDWLKQIKPVHALALVLVVLVLAYPSYDLSTQQNQGTGGPNGYWIEATQWMKYNTPDPGLDYYESYEQPPEGELYPYPDEAYGVMSWWDYGHWIEVIGHRIPNANPFQQGIGGRRNSMDEENRPGASTFFTAPSEAEATAVLEAVHPDPEKAGARYVVSDVAMATGNFMPWLPGLWIPIITMYRPRPPRVPRLFPENVTSTPWKPGCTSLTGMVLSSTAWCMRPLLPIPLKLASNRSTMSSLVVISKW